MIKKGFVYILQSMKDNKKYIGSTVDVDHRLEQHNAGYVKSTKNRRPLRIENVIDYETIEEAAYHEKQFKRSSGALKRAVKNLLNAQAQPDRN
jgi:putative endonuclease